MLNYTDITQNTYIQSWTVTEIMAREKRGLLAGSTYCTCTAGWHVTLISHVLESVTVAGSQWVGVVSALSAYRDHAQRMDLCHWMTAHPELLSVTLFTDEGVFYPGRYK